MLQSIDTVGVDSVSSLFLPNQVSATSTSTPTKARNIEMHFDTPAALYLALEKLRKRLREQMTPLRVEADGKIRLQERAMIPERIYEIRLADITLQFVRRFNGPVVMYEVL